MANTFDGTGGQVGNQSGQPDNVTDINSRGGSVGTRAHRSRSPRGTSTPNGTGTDQQGTGAPGQETGAEQITLGAGATPQKRSPWDVLRGGGQQPTPTPTPKRRGKSTGGMPAADAKATAQQLLQVTNLIASLIMQDPGAGPNEWETQLISAPLEDWLTRSEKAASYAGSTNTAVLLAGLLLYGRRLFESYNARKGAARAGQQQQAPRPNPAPIQRNTAPQTAPVPQQPQPVAQSTDTTSIERALQNLVPGPGDMGLLPGQGGGASEMPEQDISAILGGGGL